MILAYFAALYASFYGLFTFAIHFEHVIVTQSTLKVIIKAFVQNVKRMGEEKVLFKD